MHPLSTLAAAGFLTFIAGLATAARANGDMGPLSINGYELVDAEYWPFIGSTPFHDPDDIEWGFYPSGATDAAEACAAQAYEQLREFFTGDCETLHDLVGQGATNRFYLWIDDYSDAALSRPRRPARLWYYNAGGQAGDYTSGAWQWEVTVNPDGSCVLPEVSQINDELTNIEAVVTGR